MTVARPDGPVSCPSCSTLVDEPVTRVLYYGRVQGPLILACPDCGCRLFPTAAEIEATREAAA